MPWAVATNSTPQLAAARLGAAGFEPPVVVTMADVADPKPAPDMYQYAAELLGVRPEECLVVEDSAAGLASGRAAGCVTVSVLPEQSDADIVCAGLPGLVLLLRAALG